MSEHIVNLLCSVSILLLGFLLGLAILGVDFFPRPRVKRPKVDVLKHMGTKAGW